MARSIFELVFRAVDQGAASAIAALQNALAGVQGVATHAGTAVQSSVSHIGTAVQSSVSHIGIAVQGASSQTVSAVQHAATATSHAVQQAATSASHAVQQTAAQANQAAESIGSRFAQLAATIGAMGFLNAAIDEFAGFDDAMLRVQALSKASGTEFEALKAKAAELGASTKFTAVEAAEGMSQLAAAGYNTAQVLDAIGPAMHAAAAGGSDLGETADQITNIMGAFQLQSDQAGRVADALTAGFTGAATTLDQLANAMVYCGPVANTLGYTLQDTTGILMALADVGIKGEMAGTALRGGMARLIRPMRMAKNVLEKYNIQLRNADGSMRDFVDILHDVGEAGLTEGEKIKLFGIEAGPAMMALMDKGRDAIKKYQQQVNESGGRAKEISDHMESGIGGALRRLSAAWSAFKNSFGEGLAPAVTQLADALAAVAAWFAKMPDWVKQTFALWAVATTLIGVFGLVSGAVKLVAAGFASLFAPLASLTANTITYARGVALLSGNVAALKFVLRSLNSVAVAAFSGWFIGEWLNQFALVRKAGVAMAAGIEKSMLRAKLAWAWVTGGDVDAVRHEIEQADKIFAEMYAEIGTEAEKYKQKVEAAHKGATNAAKTSAQAIVTITEEELEEMQKRWQDYVKQVRDLQDQIAGRQKSLAAELREMGRSGMDDVSAWQDQRREAEEYMAAARRAAEEAKAAFAEGDTITAAAKWKEAVQYADDAKSAYRALNQEVKDGDQTVISKAQALQTAMQGVKSAGELGISVLKEQQETTLQAMKSLEEEAKKGGVADALTEGMDEAEKKWLETFKKMSKAAEETGQQVYKVWKNAAGFWTNVDDAFSAGFSKSADNFTVAWNGAYTSFERAGKDAAAAVSKAIDQAAKDRTATIYVRHVEQRALGGLIGAAGAAMRQLASGGKLPGYGGGDRVSALLEAGEFVVRKEAVRRFGSGFFESLNGLKLPDLSALLPALPKPALAAAGTAADRMILELRLPGGDTVTASVSGNDAEKLRRMNRRVSNLGFRR